MEPVIQDSAKIIATLGNLFKKEGAISEFEILSKGECSIEITGFDNWNNGTDICSIFCKVPLDIYSKYEKQIQSLEKSIKNKTETLIRPYSNCYIGSVIISPILTCEIHGKTYKVFTEALNETLELQKSLMISVSTGGPKIERVNPDYKQRLSLINEGLSERNIVNANPFRDLWEWHGKWSSGELPTWQSRREYISKMYSPVFEAIQSSQKKTVNPIFEDPTGWGRVDRGIEEIKLRLMQASNEEQYQAVGLLCRETLISLAQVVFIEGTHLIQDGIRASKTDAKRMLDSYISHELSGESNENIRRHAKASLDLANDLTHRRTAEFRLAAMCAEATNAVVNIIAIISGRRDPK